jgi:predicted double-glycine peptidase
LTIAALVLACATALPAVVHGQGQQKKKTPQYPRAPIRDPDFRTSRRVLSWAELRTRNIVMQRRDYSCGAAALATLLRYYLGDNVTEDSVLNGLDQILTLDQIRDRIKNGLSLADLRRVTVAGGYEAVVTRLTFEQLGKARVPLLVGIEEGKFKHFVVYRGMNDRWVYLADPMRGQIRLTPCQFTKQWQKNLALAAAKPGKDVPTKHALSLSDCDLYWGETSDQLLRTVPERTGVHHVSPRY